jgi:hypothetical protein
MLEQCYYHAHVMSVESDPELIESTGLMTGGLVAAIRLKINVFVTWTADSNDTLCNADRGTEPPYPLVNDRATSTRTDAPGPCAYTDSERRGLAAAMCTGWITGTVRTFQRWRLRSIPPPCVLCSSTSPIRNRIFFKLSAEHNATEYLRLIRANLVA